MSKMRKQKMPDPYYFFFFFFFNFNVATRQVRKIEEAADDERTMSFKFNLLTD